MSYLILLVVAMPVACLAADAGLMLDDSLVVEERAPSNDIKSQQCWEEYRGVCLTSKDNICYPYVAIRITGICPTDCPYCVYHTNPPGKTRSDEDICRNCTVYGDPHVITFDGSKFIFNGDLSQTYIIAKSTAGTAYQFKVTVTLDISQHPNAPHIVNSVIIVSGGKTYVLRRGTPTIEDENGSDLLPGISAEAFDKDIVLLLEDKKMINIRLENSMLITFKGSKLELYMPTSVDYETEGICGNNDGDPTNDSTDVSTFLD